MKKVILLVLWNLALSAPMFYAVSCGPSREEVEQMERERLKLLEKLDPQGKPVGRKIGDYEIIVIDECEYIQYGGNSQVLTHKGNCSNPIHNQFGR